MRFRQTLMRRTPLTLAAAAAVCIAGCAHRHATTWQGYIEGKFVYVSSPQSGRLDQLSVTRGETIDAGHPLFQLDNEPETDEVHQAEQLLRTSRSRLADLQTGKRPAEIDVTRAQLTQSLAGKKQADQILASDEVQYGAGGISQADLINARAAAESSTAKVQELEASLAVDALPARAQQIRAQREQVAADRASLAGAEWKLGQKQIASPRQGLVFDTLYRRGEWVAAGNPVVELLPPENIEIRFFVPEPAMGKLRIGESVRVNCDGCPAGLSAAITFISPQNEYTPPVIYSNENRSKLVFMVIAKASAQQAANLHPGQPVEIALQ
jgi:HlyD family secretion protein